MINFGIKNIYVISFPGNIETAKAAKMLLDDGSFSSDVMHLQIQEGEEYVESASYRADEQGQLHKGVACFMIIGFK